MAEYLTIQSPEIFHIKDKYGSLYYGADQIWYPTTWQQRAGCGPTTCSHLLWYLGQTRPSCKDLTKYYEEASKESFLSHMEKVWSYVTPGRMGVNKTSIFTEGAFRFGKDFGIPLECNALNIPAKACQRPSEQEAVHFLERSFKNNLPVGFLNLSNGKLSNLDNWHWVTLVGYNSSKGKALMYDQGKQSEIDFSLWLKTTKLGGGLVTVSPAA